MSKYTRLLKKLKDDSYEIEYENDNISEKDETILYVKLNEKQDAISKFSDGEDVQITPELSNFLQEDKEYFKLDKPLNIRINCEKELSLEDKDDIKRAVRNTFTKKVSDINEDLYSNKIECIFMLIGTLLFLGLYVLFRFLEPLGIVAEIMLIITWVFMWQFTESIVFKRPQMSKEAVRLYKLLNARIDFYE